jgi:hypothetical protein
LLRLREFLLEECLVKIDKSRMADCVRSKGDPLPPQDADFVPCEAIAVLKSGALAGDEAGREKYRRAKPGVRETGPGFCKEIAIAIVECDDGEAMRGATLQCGNGRGDIDNGKGLLLENSKMFAKERGGSANLVVIATVTLGILSDAVIHQNGNSGVSRI